MGEERILCKHCRTWNRLSRPGNIGFRCGRCRADLPTPHIVRYLEKVRDELARIASEYRWFDRPGRHDQLALELRKQEAIVANLAAVNGYKTTRSASLDLVVDIEVRVWDLQRKLSSSVFKAAQAVLRTLLEVLLKVKMGGQQALPPGRSNSPIR